MHTFSLPRMARPAALLSVGVLSTLGASSLLRVGPAQAQSPGVNLATLAAKVTALQGTVKTQADLISGLQIQINQQSALIGSLQNAAAALKAKTAPISVSGTPGTFPATLTITGVNVQIVNGEGLTETKNGLGNLIVGYNETRNDGTNERGGSHNIVTGLYNNFTTYGGIVGGYGNTLSGAEEFAVGVANAVSGDYASVSGGTSNKADGYASSVSGGLFNTAGNYYASVSGGRSNTAGGDYASVSGGYGLTQQTEYGWVAGSEGGTAYGGNFTSP